MSAFGKGYVDNAQAPTDFQKRTVDSNVYTGRIKAAFVGQSKGGASNLTLEILLSNGKTFKETVYITNRNGENTYTKDGVVNYLPGFLLINDLAVFATGKDLFQLESSIEDRIVKLYNAEQKKELPTTVPMVMDLIDTEVLVAIEEVRENKTKDNGSGTYIPTSDSRTKNTLAKAFDLVTKRTAVEIADGKDTPEYHDGWVEQHAGKLTDNYKEVEASANASTASAPSSAGMFGKR